MSEPKRKPVFIEKIFPVKLLNEQVYYEHGGNPFKGLHRWYSRKPLSLSRASVLRADVSMEEFEYLLGLNRRVQGFQDKTTKLYKTPPTPERIEKVHDLDRCVDRNSRLGHWHSSRGYAEIASD
jgi:putative DNA methylase